MNIRAYVPLVGFVVPTVIIGYGVVIPRSCIAGVNELTIGFASTIAGACSAQMLYRLLEAEGCVRCGQA